MASGVARITGPEPRILDRAEQLASGIAADIESLDEELAQAVENWRMSRSPWSSAISCDSGIHELRLGAVPPKVAIDEAVKLAHWFGGARAAAFVNGILDGVARSLGRL